MREEIADWAYAELSKLCMRLRLALDIHWRRKVFAAIRKSDGLLSQVADSIGIPRSEVSRIVEVSAAARAELNSASDGVRDEIERIIVDRVKAGDRTFQRLWLETRRPAFPPHIIHALEAGRSVTLTPRKRAD